MKCNGLYLGKEVVEGVAEGIGLEFAYVGIDFCGFAAFVAEKGLNNAQVGTGLHQVSSE